MGRMGQEDEVEGGKGDCEGLENTLCDQRRGTTKKSFLFGSRWHTVSQGQASDNLLFSYSFIWICPLPFLLHSFLTSLPAFKPLSLPSSLLPSSLSSSLPLHINCVSFLSFYPKCLPLKYIWSLSHPNHKINIVFPQRFAQRFGGNYATINTDMFYIKRNNHCRILF